MKFHFSAIICAACLLFSCATVSAQKSDAPESDAFNSDALNLDSPIPDALVPPEEKPPFILTFAGDIMAHSVNWQMDDYSLIYKDIEYILQNDDLSFANFETPVDDSKPYKTYPAFNVKQPYAQAAINAGFDVFSLANNHTNDQGLGSINATREFFANTAASDGRRIYSAGIKPAGGAPLTYALINIRGLKILFAAVTEILNSPSNAAQIDYIAPNKKSREEFIARIAEMRLENPGAIFVLSFHSNEEEYIHTVSEAQKKYYRDILGAGVDILWANHVHVARYWEMIGGESENHFSKIIFYSAGNTISGQRTSLSFSNPANNRDNTGDGFLFSVRIEETENAGWKIASVTPIIITTYRDEEGRYVIKLLDDNFINALRENKKTDEALYFTKRKTIMEEINGLTAAPLAE